MQFLRPSTVLLALLLDAASAAESADRPHGDAVRLSLVPTLDGNVADDPAWDGLAPFTGFTQLRPDNGAPASQRTEVYFGFTDDALHVGVICFETDPGAITVSNDGFQSDSFSMVLDTFGTGLAGMVFGTNPVGAEYDGQVADEFADWNWSTLWDVRTRAHDGGWSAEFAIPFQSLRYGSGEVQSWRVNFARGSGEPTRSPTGRRCPGNSACSGYRSPAGSTESTYRLSVGTLSSRQMCWGGPTAAPTRALFNTTMILAST